MPLKCCVNGCHAKYGQDKVSFHHFPTARTARDGIRRELWIEAVGMKMMDVSKSVVCGQHFMTGKPAHANETSAENWIPSLRLGDKRKIETNVASENPHCDLQCNEFNNDNESIILFEDDQDEFVEVPDNFSDIISEDWQEDDQALFPDNESIILFEDDQDEFVEVPDNFSEDWLEDNQANQEQEQLINDEELIKSYEEKLGLKDREIERLEKIIKEQRKVLKTFKFDLKSFENEDVKVKHFTGLSSYTTLVLVFKFVEKGLLTFSNVLSKEQAFIMVLMYLRLGLSFNTLGYMFGVCPATITKYFYSTLYSLFKQLKGLVKWPAPDILANSCPTKYRNIFSDNITVIIDCFEIFTEKPGVKDAILKMYSNYKHHYTAKEMIGVTSFGSIAFISKPYTGRTSDKYITEKCGFLDHLHEGDLVLADRGFTVRKAINDKGATLKVPESASRAGQMSSAAVARTRALASIRNEVERVIGGLRQKYGITSSRLPITLLNHEHNGEALLNMIVIVCCALYNLCPSIIKN